LPFVIRAGLQRYIPSRQSAAPCRLLGGAGDEDLIEEVLLIKQAAMDTGVDALDSAI
jgi:hypothetical protein